MKGSQVLKITGAIVAGMLLAQCIDGDYGLYTDNYERQSGYKPEGVQDAQEFEAATEGAETKQPVFL